MKELIAFTVMVIVIAVLIEFNERRKAKLKKEDCPQDQPSDKSCTECDLVNHCNKKSTVEP